MKTAIIKAVPALIAIEFEHGLEIIPTTINGKRTQYVSIDGSSSIVAWAASNPPEFGRGVWQLDCNDLLEVGFVDGAESYYPHAAYSLRRITFDTLLAASYGNRPDSRIAPSLPKLIN